MWPRCNFTEIVGEETLESQRLPCSIDCLISSVVFTSANKDVFVVLLLSVCLLATLRKTAHRICIKSSGKVGNGPVNKRLNFGLNPGHHLDTAENYNRLSRVHERYRQTTDRRHTTDGRATAYEFTFAKNEDNIATWNWIGFGSARSICLLDSTYPPIVVFLVEADLVGLRAHQ